MVTIIEMPQFDEILGRLSGSLWGPTAWGVVVVVVSLSHLTRLCTSFRPCEAFSFYYEYVGVLCMPYSKFLYSLDI